MDECWCTHPLGRRQLVRDLPVGRDRSRPGDARRGSALDGRVRDCKARVRAAQLVHAGLDLRMHVHVHMEACRAHVSASTWSRCTCPHARAHARDEVLVGKVSAPHHERLLAESLDYACALRRAASLGNFERHGSAVEMSSDYYREAALAKQHCVGPHIRGQRATVRAVGGELARTCRYGAVAVAVAVAAAVPLAVAVAALRRGGTPQCGVSSPGK